MATTRNPGPRRQPDPPLGATRDRITVVGARENNLKNLTVEIPKDAVTVVTGVSGSGKSSLVFDTIAAESQRQLNETFPAFVRNRLPHHRQPDVDTMHNLPPAIVVDQRPLGRNARSTVGTATEAYTLLRLLYSRASTPFVGYSPAFSFNDPSGMCPRCQGLGAVDDIDIDRLIDRDRSLIDGAIRFPTFLPGTVRWKRYIDCGLFDNHKPLRDYTDDEWHTLLHGEGFKPPDPSPGWPPSSHYEGVLPRFRRMYLAVNQDKLPAHVVDAIDDVVTRRVCPGCGGARLTQAALTATVEGRTIAECVTMEVRDLAAALRRVDIPPVKTVVAALVDRLEALVDVGLGYLTLNRETPSLSGGEAQRVKLVRHLGSSLSGLLYVLDEPSIGLHPHDIGRLNRLIRRLRDKGNTVLLVEHDPEVIRVADHLIELGPGAGTAGGEILYNGDLDGARASNTPTGAALRQRPVIKPRPRTATGGIEITHARRHNLADVTVSIPRGVLTVVTGVAGSGKSSLVTGVLPRVCPDVVIVDQSAVHGSRRSTPASFTGVLDPIRRLFARVNGVRPALFSANSEGGCPRCRGLGVIETDLAFLESVSTVCDECGGSRYAPAALAHTVHGRTIVDVLGSTAADAAGFFDAAGDDGAIVEPLRRLVDVGLGYLTLDQPVSTLSGGERQRIKLARELDVTGQVYVFDEPTTGLHRADTIRLMEILDGLVDQGATVVVIEHDPDVVAGADWVIELGPGAGHDGGRVVAAGTPADLLAHPRSLSAEYLGAPPGDAAN
ncbi:ATP-binding cassette domain-containing protein [Phytoactinopolyspora halotolerans]|uniref:UvrABC system protein A n=1 Tax=Phytoactinopolyspora halotolerans TaxID=1981512 RepID=A0A6L9S9J6_9ACTN|nr:excinuclease ABC subunit UvrA [Phytoactinopolyspora halotolerans]NEE01371.1 excinuclease ABC subunit UvrA [Phytoactinopolyspora halotolerans]